MTNGTSLGATTRGLGFALIVISLVAYFGYFAIYGKHGLVNWVQLQQQIDIKQADLDRVRDEHLALEHRVKMLRPESVDPDLLEEQARARLGLSGPDEVVILRDKH
ncbi:MAG: septum formation initiator family protein [Micropepsaceae bacterium]